MSFIRTSYGLCEAEERCLHGVCEAGVRHSLCCNGSYIKPHVHHMDLNPVHKRECKSFVGMRPKMGRNRLSINTILNFPS